MKTDKGKSRERKRDKAKLIRRISRRLAPSSGRPTMVHRDKRKERTSKVSRRELEREVKEGTE